MFPKMLAVLRGTHQQVKNWARRVEEVGLTAPGCRHPRNPNRESWAPQPHPHGAHALFRKARTLVWCVRNKGNTALLRETAARPRGVGLSVGVSVHPLVAVGTMQVHMATLVAQTVSEEGCCAQLWSGTQHPSLLLMGDWRG